MDPDITFVWRDWRYKVESRAYNLSRIVLPDGTVLQVTEWLLEPYPPQVGRAEEVNHLFRDLPVAEIAERMNACVARYA
ncbi:hypothetical protein HYW61_01955 [candidate division WWE3 bacterium]|nr:hypothetical protein [candidate division WWE3 bacterium]